MPVNSFEQYNMTWKPQKESLRHPIYLSLAEQLEEEIRSGRLRENAKLPPQRELADYLDLNLSTITRAYQLCERKGLIYAGVGRGTFVSPHVGAHPPVMGKPGECGIEMGIVRPFDEDNTLVCRVGAELFARPFAERFFDYSHPLGTPYQRSMLQDMMARFGYETDAGHIILAAGAQNALSVALVSLFYAGSRIAVDPYTYPNFINLANMLNVQLVPIRGDAEGMEPEELEKACKLHEIRGVYLMPACSNPTNFEMGEARKKELARVIERQQLILLEDDSYAFLAKKQATPIACLLPEQSIYINGLSKSVSGGLRVAALAFPERFRAQLERGIYCLNLKTPSFNNEIAAEIIKSGMYVEVMQKKRARSMARNRIYESVMAEVKHIIHPISFYQWFPIPRPCTGKLFEALLLRHGVSVYGSERFSTGDTGNGAYIRIATASPQDDGELERGLLAILQCWREVQQKEPALIV